MKQAREIEKSIGLFGLCQPIVVNTDNTIIGGHQRYHILKKLKYQTVDCYYPDRELTPYEAEQLAIRLNKNQGEWDYDILANEFDIDDLLTAGWELQDLDLDDIESPPPKTKNPKMTITFPDKDTLDLAQPQIDTIIQKHPPTYYKVN